MIRYRRATMDDLDQLVALRLEFLEEAQNVTAEGHKPELRSALESYFRSNLANDSFIAWVACDEQRMIATSGLCFYHLPPSYKNLTGCVADIMNMYTHPNYRNLGIATNLFKKITDEAINLGYKKLTLHATEKGKPLYLKFGFECSDNEMVLNIK